MHVTCGRGTKQRTGRGLDGLAGQEAVLLALPAHTHTDSSYQQTASRRQEKRWKQKSNLLRQDSCHQQYEMNSSLFVERGLRRGLDGHADQPVVRLHTLNHKLRIRIPRRSDRIKIAPISSPRLPTTIRNAVGKAKWHSPLCACARPCRRHPRLASCAGRAKQGVTTNQEPNREPRGETHQTIVSNERE